MIVSFNKQLSFPKIVIYRSFDQNPNEIENISHFGDEYQLFFDLITLNQLRDAARVVALREKSTSLAKMFSIELKFTVDTLKLWFEKIIKQRLLDLEYQKKIDFRKQHPITEDTLYSICDFPLNPQVKGGWFDHVIESEYLFLNNIYDKEQMKKMEIEKLDDYCDIIYRLANNFEEFEEFVQNQTSSDNVRDFFDPEEFETFRDLREEIEKIDIPKRRYAKDILVFKDKFVAFLYARFIDFVKSDKVKGVPISQKFISNVIDVPKHKNCIQHSHVTGEVVEHSHVSCSEKVRENYYKIPVVAHNLFRFESMKKLKRPTYKTP